MSTKHFQLIIAMTKDGGIGLNNTLPFHNKKELHIFKTKTHGNTLVVGRKTAETLPYLPFRVIICYTRHIQTINTDKWNNKPMMIVDNMESIINSEYNKIFIAGGAEIYKLALETPNLVDTIHMSVMNNKYECDTFIDLNLFRSFSIYSQESYDDFQHYVLKRKYSEERLYLSLIKEVLETGTRRNGRNGYTISKFVNHLSFNLQNGFPLLTTKKMFFKGVIEELLFFMRGDTDSKILEEKGVNIWKGNTSREYLDSIGMTNRREGIMGPCYGYQWRYYNAKYDESNAKPLEDGVDQLKYIIDLIKNDPHSRRIMMTSLNPVQLHECVLPPCHSVFIQFYVEDSYLDMYAVNRSSDLFLGLPFNIASYALFLSIIALITNKVPRFLNITLGDSHIYSEHIEQVKEQTLRIPFCFPKLVLPTINTIEDINKLHATDFTLIDYVAHPTIKATMKS